MTWHYIFAEYLTRSNNINDLQPAGRPLLLKISLANASPGQWHEQDQPLRPYTEFLIVPLPRGAPAGRWNFWPTPWSSSPGTRACRARRCAGGWPKTVSSLGAKICGAFPG